MFVGKVFDNKKSLVGHMGNCKEYSIQKYGSKEKYNEYIEKLKDSNKNSKKRKQTY